MQNHVRGLLLGKVKKKINLALLGKNTVLSLRSFNDRAGHEVVENKKYGARIVQWRSSRVKNSPVAKLMIHQEEHGFLFVFMLVYRQT